MPEITTTTTVTAQSVVPSTTAGIDSGAVLYAAASDPYEVTNYGFVEGAVVTLSAPSFSESATIASIEVGTVTFTTSVSAVGATMTKDYAGPHQTQDGARRKRLLGLR